MSAPSVADLLRAEHTRRIAAEETLAKIVRSKAARPLVWFNRLTHRGPDFRSVDAMLRAPQLPAMAELDLERVVVDDFHRLYYDNDRRTWRDTWWLGASALKTPLDMWIYQELIVAQRPDLIVECGTAHGGSALYLASILDLVGHGEVLTIDIEGDDVYTKRPVHPRITYRTASSVDPDVVAAVVAQAAGKSTMVILDSDHSADHVYAELHAYGGIIPLGGHLIVEDTNIHGNPVRPDHPAGPAEAVARFLAERTDFVRDPIGDKFFLTFNPGGILRRTA